MTDRKDYNFASSNQIEAELCERLERLRLARNVTQLRLAEMAGVSVRTVQRMEQGEGVSLDTFIRILAALGIEDNLTALVPDPSVRPVERIRSAGKERQRARASKEEGTKQTWHWGDETDDELSND